MGERFVPVPYAALACCASPRERLCVLALYERAHGYRWAPLHVSSREFAAPGELRHESALDLLTALEQRGLIVRTGGARSRTGTIEVRDPALQDQSVDHRTDHHDPPPGAPLEQAADQRVDRRTDHGVREEVHAGVGDQNHDLSLSRTREGTQPDLREPATLDPSAGYPAAVWPELVRSVLEAAGVVPLGGKLSPQEAKAAAQIARDHPSREAIARTLRWILDDADPAAVRARGQIRDRKLRFVLSDWSEYDRAALECESRPRAPPTRRLTDDEIHGPLMPRRPPPLPE